jgi:opacity protein-like surface antigen
MIKKIMAVSVLGVSALGMMAANATTNGIYVTGQAGYADTHMKNSLSFTRVPGSKPMPNGGLAGRLAIGYQFNSNLAVELGYLQMSKLKSISPQAPNYLRTSLAFRQNAIDVAAKGILPLNDKFNVYGKLGVAYLTNDTTISSKSIKYNDNKALGLAQHNWAPEAGVGASYNVTPNAFIDTSWTHIQPLGKNRPNNVDFVSVGIGYSFG